MIKTYFKAPYDQLACPCCGLMPDPEAVEELYALRIHTGIQMKVTSGARCKKHNKVVGGKDSSYHLELIAFDIVVQPVHEWELIGAAVMMGWHGIGINNNKFIHIDRRIYDERAVWTY